MNVRRGDIWSVNLDPAAANEQHGTRPCVVASVDRFQAMPINQAFVVPLTTRDRGLPHHIRVRDDGSLNRASWAMCEAMRAVSTQRFGRRIGAADGDTLSAITDQLSLWLLPM